MKERIRNFYLAASLITGAVTGHLEIAHAGCEPNCKSTGIIRIIDKPNYSITVWDPYPPSYIGKRDFDISIKSNTHV